MRSSESALVVQVLQKLIERIDEQVARRASADRIRRAATRRCGQRVAPAARSVAREACFTRRSTLRVRPRPVPPLLTPDPAPRRGSPCAARPQFVSVGRQLVRLQIEQQLQRCSIFRKKPVRIGEDVRFLRVEAAGDFERFGALRACSRCRTAGQVAAVE